MGLKLDKTGAISPEKTKYIPGPGTYEPDFKSNSNTLPSYSMKGRHEELKRLVVPGPGSYESSLKDKKSAPQFGFGSSPQREPIKKTLSPGPGGYRIPSSIADVPAFALPNRPDEFKYI